DLVELAFLDQYQVARGEFYLPLSAAQLANYCGADPRQHEQPLLAGGMLVFQIVRARVARLERHDRRLHTARLADEPKTAADFRGAKRLHKVTNTNEPRRPGEHGENSRSILRALRASVV